MNKESLNSVYGWLKDNGFSRLHTKNTTFSKAIPLGHAFLEFNDNDTIKMVVSLTYEKNTSKNTFFINAEEMEYEDFIEEFPQLLKDIASERYQKLLNI